jgi:hypothetical protein
MDEHQKQRAIVALRRLESEKDIKRYKLNEHFQNVRLCLLLRIPYAVIKMHHNCRMSVCNETGLVRFQFPDEYIPIWEYLKRDDSPSFEQWLGEFHPEEFEEYKRDKIRFLFGTNKELRRTDAAQGLYDEYEKFTWYQSEKERRYYFSGLLADCDISAMDEFQLFGAVGSHSQQEISDFKEELEEMKVAYLEHPEKFFHPDMADLNTPDAVASGSDIVSGEGGTSPPGCLGEGVSHTGKGADFREE